MNMQFGMPTLIENRTLQDNVNLCKRLNLRFIELNMNFPEYQVESLEHVDALVKSAEEAGIYYTIHLDENLNIADFNPLVSEAYLETVRRSIEVVKKLIPLRDRYGNKAQPLTLNMHMNHGIYITLPDRKVQMYDRDFDTYMKSFRNGSGHIGYSIRRDERGKGYGTAGLELAIAEAKKILVIVGTKKDLSYAVRNVKDAEIAYFVE